MNPEHWRDDDGPTNEQLDVGRDCLATADREGKLAGSARFADDDPEAPDAGSQSAIVPDGDPDQLDLTGDRAAEPPEWVGRR